MTSFKHTLAIIGITFLASTPAMIIPVRHRQIIRGQILPSCNMTGTACIASLPGCANNTSTGMPSESLPVVF
ncbi:hypothetical protein K439DRAFT_1639885 [Ramaria rubella]|nr:hypothetical protein K439DRAFT_1639885 [Ramaria rubella]